MQKHEKPEGSTEYSCKLQLPCNAPFEKLEGPMCSSIRLAQQVMAVPLEQTIIQFLPQFFHEFGIMPDCFCAGCLFSCL